MKDKCFVDTNIWVYASLSNDKDIQKRNIAIKLIQNNNYLNVNTQVLNEFYNTFLKYKINDEEILTYIDEIVENTNVHSQNIETLKKAWLVKKKYTFSLWDSLIIASTLQNNCSILYTEDLQHK